MTIPGTIPLTSSRTSTPQTGITGLYKAFWRHAAGNRPLVALFMALLFVAQAVRLTIPWFFGQAVNAIQTANGQDMALAAWNMAMMFGACVVAWAMHAGRAGYWNGSWRSASGRSSPTRSMPRPWRCRCAGMKIITPAKRSSAWPNRPRRCSASPKTSSSISRTASA